MATISLDQPQRSKRKWRITWFKPAELRMRERVLVIDEETDDEEENFVGYWWGTLPLAQIKRLPPESRVIASNALMIWLWVIMGGIGGLILSLGSFFLLYQNMLVAIITGAMPGLMLGSIAGFAFGYLTRLRPLIVLKRHRMGRVVPVLEPIDVTPMLHGVSINLFAIRASYMANVIKQVASQRIFSIANPAYRKQEMMGLILAGLAMAGIIIFTLVLSSDPKLTGSAEQPPPAVAPVEQEQPK